VAETGAGRGEGFGKERNPGKKEAAEVNGIKLTSRRLEKEHRAKEKDLGEKRERQGCESQHKMEKIASKPEPPIGELERGLSKNKGQITGTKILSRTPGGNRK